MTHTISPDAFDDKSIAILRTASTFAYQIFQHEDAKLFLQRFALHDLLGEGGIQNLVDEYTNYGNNEDAVFYGLRKLRKLLMMRWIYQDVLGYIDVCDLMQELSYFADAAINSAKNVMYQKLIAKYGIPRTKNGQIDELLVIAMGKLGAKELNLSSDIDLIFVHKACGYTDGKKSIDNQKFMIQLGRGIIRLLDENSSEGFVFRVDMRLRPWGDGAPLVIAFAGLQKYLSQHGRTWERFAWLKARVVNAAHAKFLKDIEQVYKNFVFRHYADYTTFTALREMRELISNQVAQREDLDNIKLGIGGIRDIEFIAQSFALIYGGQITALMTKTACLDALYVLMRFDIINQSTYSDLKNAYRFLRKLEHALQARHDTQTHARARAHTLCR